jgi:hypothetical protein
MFIIFDSIGLIVLPEKILIIAANRKTFKHVKNYKVRTGNAPIYEKSLGRNITINIIIILENRKILILILVNPSNLSSFFIWLRD